MADIPIRFARPLNGSSEYYLTHPCVSGKFSTSVEAFESNAHDVLLSVDTGADHMAIDHDFALALGMKPTGFTVANAEQGVPIFNGAIRIDGIELTIPVRMVSRPLTKAGAPFQVILGRIVLNLFEMTYRPMTGESFLRLGDIPPGLVGKSLPS